MPLKKRRTIREFIHLETSGGIILFTTAVLAFVISNTPLEFYYHAFFSLPMTITFGSLKLSKPFLLWVNDGLMTIFFLLVGLEMKRELFEGELNSLKKAALPAVAAIGGMLVPALIYFSFNSGDPAALRGWAIPTATDIAFSLGILALLGSRVPVSLKIFLTALAIFDDMGAIVIIAIFYTENISLMLLLLALGFTLFLVILNRLKVMRFWPYVLVGFALWVCVLKSGVHATLSGILLAFAIPLRDRRHRDRSPLRILEHKLHPWVAFGVLPLFAFANAGVALGDLTLGHLTHPVFLGIALGLFLGKPLGICLASLLGVVCRVTRLPQHIRYLDILGVSLISGVGFTMSLFIGTLAFGSESADHAVLIRLGVILGSFLSGVLGYFILKASSRKFSLS